MTDDLEQRLRAADPLPRDVPVETADTPSARNLMERIMETETETETETDTDTDPQPVPGAKWGWRRVAVATLGAAAAVVIAVGAVAVLSDGGDDSPSIATPDPSAEVVTFELAASDPMMGMCLTLNEFVPDPATVAFAGTVTAVDADKVTLDVTRWYTDGDAAVVELQGPTDVPVALDGVEFVVGGNYLVSVLNNEVLICGVSAPVSPELEQLYQQWYS